MRGSDYFLKTERTHNSHRGIIVGFDPGLTVGIAILDLNGALISIGSYKEIRRSEIVSHIIAYGRTVLLATDVYPPPKTVRKLASILNSKIWSPYRSMSVESKIEIVDSYLQCNDRDKKSFEQLPQNAHERDALAAAVKTYRDHLNKFRQIDKRAEMAELSYEEVETVKIMVINGTSISNSIAQILEDREKKIDDPIKQKSEVRVEGENLAEIEIHAPPRELSKNLEETVFEGSKRIMEYNDKQNSDMEVVSKLKNKLKNQERYIEKLKEKNTILEEQVQIYRTEISKLHSHVDKLHYEYKTNILKEKELVSKIAIIKRLKEKYSDEKKRRSELEKKFRTTSDIRALELSENAVPVKIIESFTKDGIREACDFWKIKRDDVILLKNSEGGGSHTASMIIQMGVKAVITMDKISDPAEHEFESNLVPIIPSSTVQLKFMKEFAIVNSKSLENEIEGWNKKISNQKETEDKIKLLKLVDEYRAQRRRSVDR
jgi:predicted RNase H-like nuclease (RuvC/YqgF family)